VRSGTVRSHDGREQLFTRELELYDDDDNDEGAGGGSTRMGWDGMG
jgi:hypothetical protein